MYLGAWTGLMLCAEVVRRAGVLRMPWRANLNVMLLTSATSCHLAGAAATWLRGTWMRQSLRSAAQRSGGYMILWTQRRRGPVERHVDFLGGRFLLLVTF